MKRRILLAATALAFVPQSARAAEPEIFTGLAAGVAVGGYDAVSYFADGGPVEGSKDIAMEWKGAAWHFSSAANLAAFAASPEKYAPQYGGYCAYAVSRGATAKGEPLAWTVADGKLYLNYSQEVRTVWRQDIPGNVARASANWPDVLQ